MRVPWVHFLVDRTQALLSKADIGTVVAADYGRVSDHHASCTSPLCTGGTVRALLMSLETSPSRLPLTGASTPDVRKHLGTVCPASKLDRTCTIKLNQATAAVSTARSRLRTSFRSSTLKSERDSSIAPFADLASAFSSWRVNFPCRAVTIFLVLGGLKRRSTRTTIRLSSVGDTSPSALLALAGRRH